MRAPAAGDFKVRGADETRRAEITKFVVKDTFALKEPILDPEFCAAKTPPRFCETKSQLSYKKLFAF